MIETTKKQLNVAKKIANDLLHKLTTNQYFNGIPINQMSEILRVLGFNTANLEGFYCGHEGRCNERMSFLDKEAWFTFTWYRMPSGRLEIVAYVS